MGPSGDLMKLLLLFDVPARWALLDKLAEPLVGAVVRLPVPVRRFLNGRALGHPLHAALVHVPLGGFLVAPILAAVPSTRPALRVIGVVGLATSVPLAVTGIADLTRLPTGGRRIALVHATLNVLSLLIVGPQLLRKAPARVEGVAFGAAVAGAAAALGGHLAYRYREREPVEWLAAAQVVPERLSGTATVD
jgi:hypothetical protein